MAAGLAIGSLMIALIAGLLVATGMVVPGRNPELDSSALLLASLGTVAAAANEELLFRGYPLQILARSLGAIWSTLLVALLFGLAHAMNPETSTLAVLNTVLAAGWLSLAYFRTGSLWLPYGLHLGWNLLERWLGFSVSGGRPNALLELKDVGPDWLTGGLYGPEAGLPTTLLLLLSSAAIWRLFGPVDWRAKSAPSGARADGP